METQEQSNLALEKQISGSIAFVIFLQNHAQWLVLYWLVFKFLPIWVFLFLCLLKGYQLFASLFVIIRVYMSGADEYDDDNTSSANESSIVDDDFTLNREELVEKLDSMINSQNNGNNHE